MNLTNPDQFPLKRFVCQTSNNPLSVRRIALCQHRRPIFHLRMVLEIKTMPRVNLQEIGLFVPGCSWWMVNLSHMLNDGPSGWQTIWKHMKYSMGGEIDVKKQNMRITLKWHRIRFSLIEAHFRCKQRSLLEGVRKGRKFNKRGIFVKKSGDYHTASVTFRKLNIEARMPHPKLLICHTWLV